MNVADTLTQGRRDHPDRVAILFDGEAITYAALDRAASRMARRLREAGVDRGDRVALLLPNVPAFVSAYFGALKIGAIAVSINTGLSAPEVRFILEDSGARVLITLGDLRDLAEAVRPASLASILFAESEGSADTGEYVGAITLDADTPAAIVYTSGTTGAPKGAMLSHANVTFVMKAKQQYLGIRPEDRLLLFLPLYHCFGQNAILNAALCAGATIVLQRGFDPAQVLDACRTQGATMLFGVPATFIVLLERADAGGLGSLRYCFSAAAPLPVPVEIAWQGKFGFLIHQGYGLTETSPFASYNHVDQHRPGSIGVPIAGVEMDVVDVTTGARVAAGERGELVIRGANVMLGYWRQPAETAAVIRDGWFHTGDIGHRDAEGYFFIEDRLKDLIIVGGSNVYPAEVERVLQTHPAVAEVAVYGVPDAVLGEQVRAAIVLAKGFAVSAGELLAWCRGRIAAFKTPAAIDVVAELPRNRTGKILKRVLRDQHAAAIGGRAPVAAAAPDAVAVQRWIAGWLATALETPQVSFNPDRPLSEYGVTSLIAVDLAAALAAWLERPVTPTLAWHHPSIHAIALHLGASRAQEPAAPAGPAASASTSEAAESTRVLQATQDLQARLTALETASREPIAIVGMGCRYPGAANLAAFWELLRGGIDAVTEVPPERWDLNVHYHPDPARPGTMTSRWAGLIDRLDEFDAAFFGISPREAPHVDPRQRLALEIAWEALEDAGIPADTLSGTRTGVFMATLTNDYDHLLFEDLRRAEAYSGAGTANSIVANRLSYVMDLRGPSVALDTACSGSLVAVHLACESLRRGESTIALAGGVNVNLMPKSNVFFSKAGALSPNGRCRTFDRNADGMVRSDGAGILILKRLSQAIADGDRITAVIRGSAVNHDGRSNGLMAPNGEAQRAVLTEAYQRAGVSPADVQYIEAHGTGTKLGDPIEVASLAAVLTPDRPSDRKCLLGSVKTNIGHSEAAAAVAGVIKTALALRHRVVPPTLHFVEPNPLIELDRLPFAVPTAETPWPSPDRPLIAGVSGFGFGGTNAHVVLEAAPTTDPSTTAATTTATIAAPFILPISARTPRALAALAATWRDRLRNGDAEEAVADLCIAAARERTHHAQRAAFVGASAEALRAGLDRWIDTAAAATASAPEAEAKPLQPVFVFSGQGSHWPRMGLELYAREPIFAAALDDCDRLFRDLAAAAAAGQPVLSILEELTRAAGDSHLDDTAITQPAIFSIQIALFALWQSYGITPATVIGHSLGEVAAACAAGALSRQDGARIVFHRSRLMARVAGRGRTAVVGLSLAAAREAVRPYEPALAVAGSNGPDTSVIAGDPVSVERLQRMLDARGIFCRIIPGVSVAFHSPQMDPLRPELIAALTGLSPRPATIPIISTVTGTPVDGETLDATYWGRNLREPFLFADAIGVALAQGANAFIEVSPHPVLSSSITACLRRAGAGAGVSAPVLASLRRGEPEADTLLGQLARLYEAGLDVNWAGVYQTRPRSASAPHYPWQRQRFWFDQLATTGTSALRVTTAIAADAHPLLGTAHPIEPATNDAAAGRVYLWETTYDETNPPYVADHRVRERAVLPGAAIVEIAGAAARHLWPDRAASVADLRFENAMQLSDGARRVQIALKTREDAPESGEMSVHSRPIVNGRPDGAWTRHAACQLIIANADRPVDEQPTLTLAQVQAQCVESIAPESHYDAMKTGGLHYGPAFRGLRGLWAGSRDAREALAEIALPPDVRDARYTVHPALLDAALQTVAAIVRRDDPASHYLPAGLQRWQIDRPITTDRVWCHARLVASEGDRLIADLDLLDDRGSLLAQLQGLTLARFGLPRPLALAGSLIEERWEPRPQAATPVAVAAKRWLLLADIAGVAERTAEQLRARGHVATVARPQDDIARVIAACGDLDGVVSCAALDAAGLAEATDLAAKPKPLHGVKAPAALAAASADADTDKGLAGATGLTAKRDRPEAAAALDGAGADADAGQAIAEATELAAKRDRLDGVVSGAASDAAAGLGDGVALAEVATGICIRALELTQALAAAAGRTPPRLWLITRAANLAQATLNGLALTIAQEYPELRCSTIELADSDGDEAAAMSLAGELLHADDETRVSWRGGIRHVARLVPYTLTSRNSAAGAPLRADATYLITGGLGALGLQTAAHFVRQGARHLVLTGRRGLDATSPAAQTITTLRQQQGATITVVAADVANAADVDALFEQTLASMPPLAGVVHAAGVLDDAVIAAQTRDRVARVIAPKLAGAWNLHARTQALSLDFFVCYSSAASLIGSAGQANYAAANAGLDALAAHRRTRGLPAISINWSAWAGEGMAATDHMRQRLQARGLAMIEVGDGLALLDALRADPVCPAAIGAIPADWTRFRASSGDTTPRLASLTPAAGTTPHAAAAAAAAADRVDLQSLLALAPAARATTLRTMIRRTLATVLGFDEAATEISSRAKYFDLGMDSLMAVEFRNRLQQTFEIPLPATMAFDYPTIETLAESIGAALAARTPATAAAGAAATPGPEPEPALVARTSEAAVLDADLLDALPAHEIARLLASELDEEGRHV